MAYRLWIIWFVGLLTVPFALGQRGTPEKVLFEVSGNWSHPFDSKLQGDLNDQGKTVEQSDLGVGSAWGPKVRILWKMSPGNRLRLDLNRIDLTYRGERLIDKKIEFPGLEFPINTSLKSEFKTTEFRIAYSYLFKIGSDRLRLGPLMDVRRVDADVTAQGTLGDIRLGPADFDTGTWGATIGVEFDSHPAEAVNFYGLVDWIGAGDLDGSWDVETGIRYFFTPWLGFTLAYEYTGTKVRFDDRNGFIRVQSNNLSAGVALGF